MSSPKRYARPRSAKYRIRSSWTPRSTAWAPLSAGPITQDLSVDQYWFWNLRNTVRFDKAIAAALPLGIDTFVELAEHPTLQLAIQENLAALHDEDERATTRPMVVGTSNRTASDLGEFTRNLAQLAVHDLDYPWECLGTESDGPAPLPLLDFPNTRMNETRLWQLVPPAFCPTGTPRCGAGPRTRRSNHTGATFRRGVGAAVAALAGAAACHRHHRSHRGLCGTSHRPVPCGRRRWCHGSPDRRR